MPKKVYILGWLVLGCCVGITADENKEDRLGFSLILSALNNNQNEQDLRDVLRSIAKDCQDFQQKAREALDQQNCKEISGLALQITSIKSIFIDLSKYKPPYSVLFKEAQKELKKALVFEDPLWGKWEDLLQQSS